MKTRITTIVGLLLTLFLVGEALAQVPSSVTQQLRLSTGGVTPAYVQHRAITSVSAPPSGYNAVGGWYAWDQVPATAPDVNYLLFLNDGNEVRRTSSFAPAQSTFLARVNAAGDNIEFTDPNLLVVAQNGLNELQGANVIELGGDLLRATTIDQDGFAMSFTNGNVGTPSTFTLGGGAGTLNTVIDPGANGNLTLLNIDPLLTAETVLFLDGTGNVVSRDLDGLVDADNGVTELYVAGVSTIQLGAAASGGSTLTGDRWISLAGQDMNWEGTGNFNLGDGASNVTTAIHTGATGNMTIQGTTLDDNTGVTTLLYTDGNNERRATAATLPAGTANTYLAVDAGGNIVNAPDPLGGIYRGQIAGDGGWQYGGLADVSVPVLNAGSSIICTIQNNTGTLGTISVQVTTVTAGTPGTFNVELSEVIPAGSFINWVVMNP